MNKIALLINVCAGDWTTKGRSLLVMNNESRGPLQSCAHPLPRWPNFFLNITFFGEIVKKYRVGSTSLLLDSGFYRKTTETYQN